MFFRFVVIGSLTLLCGVVGNGFSYYQLKSKPTYSYNYDALCPKQYSNCTFVHPYYATKFYQCFLDSDCLAGYKCCRDCNYVHRVCKAPVLKLGFEENAFQESSECGTDPGLCKFPLPLAYTQHMQCFNDQQCSKGNVCCKDSCYEHRICKESSAEIKVTTQSPALNYTCPMETRKCHSSLEETEHLKCALDLDCPEGQVCCEDSCSKHSICKDAIIYQLQTASDTIFKNDETELKCPVDNRYCTKPYSLEETLKYKCKKDDDCKDKHKCCEDSCFQHMICKESAKPSITSATKTPQSKPLLTCPKTTRNPDCSKINSKYYKQFQCLEEVDCMNGYKCCEDSCIDFKVCKLPNNVFAHKRFEPTVTTVAPSSADIQDPACPAEDTRCSYPFSIRLFRVIQCHRTEDCFANEICCPDSCIDFNICKTKDNNRKQNNTETTTTETTPRPVSVTESSQETTSAKPSTTSGTIASSTASPTTLASSRNFEVIIEQSSKPFYIVDIIDDYADSVEEGNPESSTIDGEEGTSVTRPPLVLNGRGSDDEDGDALASGSGSGGSLGSRFGSDDEDLSSSGSGSGDGYPKDIVEERLLPHVSNNIIVITRDQDTDFEFNEIPEVTEQPLLPVTPYYEENLDNFPTLEADL